MKRASAIALVVLVAVLGTTLSCYVRNRNLERAFDRVSVGMAEQQIVTVMGKPDSIGKWVS
jgi:outer membrane protein assembly factor BamE (lipoprotein component of BamABCDE complex)